MVNRTRSSVINSKAVQRTHQTSMSQMVGQSLLVSRPLIGSQMLKNIAAKHGSRVESKGSLAANLSSDGLPKAQQIHLEIDNVVQSADHPNESDKKVTLNQHPDSANSADDILGDKITPKQSRIGRNRTFSARKDFKIESG